MLQPLNTTPVVVSNAAPTLNWEYAAMARSRASRATLTRRWSRSRSETLNDSLQERDEVAAHPRGCLNDFLFGQWLRKHPGGHVRNARDAEDFDIHVACDDGLRDRRHADRVRPQGSKRANFRRGFIAR